MKPTQRKKIEDKILHQILPKVYKYFKNLTINPDDDDHTIAIHFNEINQAMATFDDNDLQYYIWYLDDWNFWGDHSSADNIKDYICEWIEDSIQEIFTDWLPQDNFIPPKLTIYHKDETILNYQYHD